MASRNLLCHRLRTLVLIGAIASGVVVLILAGGFFHYQLGAAAEAIICSLPGHVQIARAGFFEAGSAAPDRYVISDPGELVRVVTQIPHVEASSPLIRFSGLVRSDDGMLAIVAQGNDPTHTRIGRCEVRSEGWDSAGRSGGGAVLGEGVASSLKAKPGDRVSLIAYTGDQLNILDSSVLGIFRSASEDHDARAVRITLQEAQELLALEGVSLIAVWLDQIDRSNAVAREIAERLDGARDLEVRTWQQVSDRHARMGRVLNRQMDALRMVIFLLVMLSVTGTLNVTVTQRVAQSAPLPGSLAPRSTTFGGVMTEAALLGIAGAILGLLIGWGLGSVLSEIGIPMPPPPGSKLGYTAQIDLLPSAALGACGIGLAAALLAGALTAVHAERASTRAALKPGH
jgi:putative ABC transport system permease protein